LRGRAATFAVVCLLAVAPAAFGQERAGEGPLEEARPGGAQVLLASAAYPGLGQLLNGTEAKAAIVGAAGAFLGARLLLEDRWTRHSLRRYRETGEQAYFDQYSEHFDTRQTLMWWAIVAALYGLVDAYVDAHLADFDEPLSPSLERTLGGPALDDPSAVRVGLAIRF
jgi:hypothetical protein